MRKITRLSAACIVLILIFALLLSGCGSSPYIELGAGHDFNEMNVVIPDTGEDYSMACGVGTGEIGAEWQNGLSIAYYHQSCVNAERYSEKKVDMVILKKKWGGVQ